jgi:hypothetical protein
MWEDEANQKGGKWFVQFDPADLDQSWIDALLGVVGESLPASDSVLGIQVSGVKNNRGKCLSGP